MGEHRRSSGAGVAAGATALGAAGGAAATGIPAGRRELKVWKDALAETNKHPIFKAIYEGNKKKVHETARKTILQKAKGKARAGALIGTVLGASFGVGHMFGKNKRAAAYKLQGRLKFQGLSISIENAKGSTRTWKDPHGKEVGSTKMHFAYGYIRNTEGTDGDHVDVYVGPNPDAKMAYVIDQNKKPPGDIKKDGKAWTQFDEQKVMLGFPNAKAAKDAYNRQYDDPRFFRSLRAMTMEDFKTKVLDKSNHGKKVAMFLDNPNDPFHTPPTARHHIPPTQRKKKKAGLQVKIDHARKVAARQEHRPLVGAGIGAVSGAVSGGLHGAVYGRTRAAIASKAVAGATIGAVIGAITHHEPIARGLKAGRDARWTPQLKKQIKSELRDPRLYSNLRGMLSFEGRDKRVAAHKLLGKKKDYTVGSAMRMGFLRKKASGDMIEYFNQNPKKLEEYRKRQAAKERLTKKASLAYRQEFLAPIAMAEHQGIKLAQEYWDGMSEMEKQAVLKLLAKGVGGLLRGGAGVARGGKAVASGAKDLASRGGAKLVQKTRAGAGKLMAKGQAAGRRGAANVEASYLQGRRGLSPAASKVVQAERAGIRTADRSRAQMRKAMTPKGGPDSRLASPKLPAATKAAPAAGGPYRTSAGVAPPKGKGALPLTPKLRAVRNQRAQLRLERIKGKGLAPGSKGTGATAAAGGEKLITGKRILGATALLGAGGLAYGGMKGVDAVANLATRGGNPNYIAPRVPGIGRPY